MINSQIDNVDKVHDLQPCYHKFTSNHIAEPQKDLIKVHIALPKSTRKTTLYTDSQDSINSNTNTLLNIAKHIHRALLDTYKETRTHTQVDTHYLTTSAVSVAAGVCLIGISRVVDDSNAAMLCWLGIAVLGCVCMVSSYTTVCMIFTIGDDRLDIAIDRVVDQFNSKILYVSQDAKRRKSYIGEEIQR